MMLSTAAMLLVLVALPTPPPAEQLLDPARGAFGLVVHNPGHAKALQDLGVQWVRIPVRWNESESVTRGTYDSAALERNVRDHQAAGLGVMVTLTVEERSKLYDDHCGDVDTLTRAIASWAGEMAKRLRGKGVVWEIGNEPEVFPMDGIWNIPENAALLAQRVSSAIAKADPTSRIVALSVAWFDRSFIARALDAGLLAGGPIHAVAYHGYHRRGALPEAGLAEDVAWLRAALALHAGKHPVPAVVDSERGFAVLEPGKTSPWHSWRNQAASEDEQAAFLARHFLESLSQRVQLVVWYKDMHGEEGFSLFHGDDLDARGLRPMGHVYRNLAHLLPDNPQRMVNGKYLVTVEDAVTNQPDPDTVLEVRSFLRSTQRGEVLVMAVWNPAQAQQGKVLVDRRRVGDDMLTQWRDVTADDAVQLPVSILVHGVAESRVTTARAHKLDSAVGESVDVPVTGAGNRVEMGPVTVGAMPMVVVVELKDAVGGKKTRLAR